MKNKKILYFGDSNTDVYMRSQHDATISNYPGLCATEDMFDFHFTIAIEEDKYDLVICCIGHNDFGKGLNKNELLSAYQKIRDYPVEIIIVGPYGDIETQNLETTDGVHFSEDSKKIIGQEICYRIKKTRLNKV